MPQPDATATASPPLPSRRSRRRVVAIIAAAIVFLPLLVGTCLLIHTPSWYHPPQIAPEDRQAVRNNLVAAEQAFTENVRGPDGPFTYHLYEKDVNRWISMRREIYPLIDQLAPPLLDEPFVVFGDGLITIAGQYRAVLTRVVISLDIEARFEVGEIILTARTIRCGSIPLPMSFAEKDLSRPLDRRPDKVWPGSPAMSGDLMSGFRVSADAWWKNGGIDYRVLGFRVEPGIISLDIKPLGRHIPARRNTQTSPLEED